MLSRRTIIIAVGLALGLCLLGLTHWYAYHRGREDLRKSLGATLEKQLEVSSWDYLLMGVKVLKAAERNPGGFSKQDVAAWRTQTTRWIFDVEKKAIPAAEEMGDEELVRNMRNTVQEARGLLGKT